MQRIRKLLCCWTERGVAALAIVGLFSLFVSVAIGSNTKYPEMGPPMTSEAQQNKGIDSLIQCGLNKLPKKYKDKLRGCKASDVDVLCLNTGKIRHWKHGHVIDLDSPGFTPHATPKQLKKCDLCMALSKRWFCWEGGAAALRRKKSILKHELVHLTQYCFWPEWNIPNKDLFNNPYDANGDGKADGENGNPKRIRFRVGLLAQDAQHDADKKTRELFDKFEDLRKLMTESEATLAELDFGCTTDTSLGDYWFKPPKKKKRKQEGGGGVDGDGHGSEEENEDEKCVPPIKCDANKMDVCKAKLQTLLSEAFLLAETGHPAYAKLLKFTSRISSSLPKMCRDIKDRQKEIDMSIEKYCERRNGGLRP